MDRKFVITGMVYAILGMILGIYMAASKNHGQMVTHTHIMLAGFLISFFYGLCHKLWLNNDNSALARLQFYIHQAGLAFMCGGLFLLYGQLVKEEAIGPVLGLSSVVFLSGMLMMAFMFIKSGKLSGQ